LTESRRHAPFGLTAPWIAVFFLSAMLAVAASLSTFRFSTSHASIWVDGVGNGGLLLLTVGVLFAASFGTRRQELRDRIRDATPKVLACALPQTLVFAVTNAYVSLSWHPSIPLADLLPTAGRGVATAIFLMIAILGVCVILCVVAHVAQKSGRAPPDRRVR
jgi:hypothetical protein